MVCCRVANICCGSGGRRSLWECSTVAFTYALTSDAQMQICSILTCVAVESHSSQDREWRENDLDIRNNGRYAVCRLHS